MKSEPVSVAAIAVLALVLVCLLVLGCSKGENLPEAKRTMTLTSSDFSANQPIPAKHSANGGNVSPALAWSGAPEVTQSFALIVDDPDAPRATPFVHWVVYNIPPTTTSIAQGETPSAVTKGKNDSGTNAYFGPRPPSGTHRYIFRLYALDTMLDLKEGATKDELVKAMEGHELAMGELIGLYSAPG